MSHRRMRLLACLFLVLACTAVPAEGCNPGRSGGPAGAPEQPTPVKPLPDELLGTWTYNKPWTPEFPSPAWWAKARFSEKTFFVSNGETSKDSGSWSMQGTYTLESGKGTSDDPYVLTLRVEKGGGDGSVGYPEESGPGHKGDVLTARVHVDGGVLHFDVPKASLELGREKKDKPGIEP